MALQFPASPSLNELFDAPTGVQYQWDGEKWITVGSTTPDPAKYLRKDINDTYNNTITATSTTAFGVPVGTTAEQPSGAEGMVRYNTTLNRYEGFSDGVWGALGGGATGGGSDRVFQLNTMTVNTSFTLPNGESALSAGPITIDDGAVVTIPDNLNWVIL